MPGILSGRLFHVHNPPSDERRYRSTIARNVNEGFELWAEFHNSRQGRPGFVGQICTVQTQPALSEDELNGEKLYLRGDNCADLVHARDCRENCAL